VSEASSYRQILRSSSIIGGASVIYVLIGLLRSKVAALLLGPAGLGLIGLFTNLVATAANLAGLGFGSVGTRQVAQAVATDDGARITLVRRALFWGTLALAMLGAGAFWALRRPLAVRVLEDRTLITDVGWLALAVALSIAAASQNALLNGLRRIGDIARVTIGSAVVYAVVGIGALWAWGRAGVVVYVIAAPLASFLLGHWYVSRLPREVGGTLRFGELAREWKTLASLGMAFMVAGLAGTAGQLAVNLLVQRKFGVEGLGHFQAAWAISMTYIGFVLSAMGTDYYPRLAAVIDDHAAVNRLVNEQAEVALLLAAPVMLAMLGLAPWVIELLYSRQFGEAVPILRWQVLGDVLKVASWPLGYILVASGAGKTFMLTEWVAMTVLAGLTWMLLPLVGLVATGLSFFAMYGVLLTIVFGLARRKTGFSFLLPVRWLLAGLVLAAAAVMALASVSDVAGAIAGVVGAIAFGIFAIVRLAHAGDVSGPVGRLAAMVRHRLLRLSVWRGK
jgi:PST family polysaccharide transporter